MPLLAVDADPRAVVRRADKLYAGGFQRCFQGNHGTLSCTFRLLVIFNALNRSQ